MSVAETLKTISGRIRSRAIASKAEVRQGVILALLNELGWPVFDTNVVRPAHSINGDSVDFGLLGSWGRLVAVIIVDPLSELDVDAVEPRLYVAESAEPLVIHTNGLTWRFMLSLPPKGISCDKAFVVSTEGSLSAERFEALLRRENLEAGHAQATLARLLARKPTDVAVLMATWLSLNGTEDLALHTLLADKVEARAGNRPSVEEVAAFFRARETPRKVLDVVDEPVLSPMAIQVNPPQTREHEPPKVPISRPELHALIRQSKEQGYLTYDDIDEGLPDSVVSEEKIDEALAFLRDHGIEILDPEQFGEFKARSLTGSVYGPQLAGDARPGCWFRVGESKISAKNGKAVVLGILRSLEAQFPGFLARCAAHPENMGTSRRYIGRTPSELYPERPDYAGNPSKYAEIVPGWLLMSNFNSEVKITIIDLAASVAGLRHGQDIDYNLER